MARLLKPLLVILAVFGLVWLAVIVYWQESHRAPDTADVVLWMFALPLSLVLLIWIYRRGSQAASLRAAAAAAAPVPSTAKPAAKNELPDETERRLHWLILANAQQSALGSSGREALASLDDPSKTPQPDLALTDDEGLPVFTGRAEVLDDEALEQTRSALEAHCTEIGEPLPDWPDERLRAAALALPVLQRLAAVALEHPGLQYRETPEGLDAQAEDASKGTSGLAIPWLRVTLLLPPIWPEGQRQQFSALLRGSLERMAAEAQWPPERLTVTVHAASRGHEVLLHLDKLLLALHREQANDLCLMLAAESLVGENTIAVWQDQGWLRSAEKPNGSVPGEAAAGLLLATPAASAAYTTEFPVQLHRASMAPREKPVTAAGRSSVQTLNTLTGFALKAAGVEAQNICGVVSDAEAKPDHAAELGLFITESLPELDAVADLYSVGAVTGAAGLATTLAGLGAAQALVAAKEKPVLFVASANPIERGVVVLRVPLQPVPPVLAR